MTNKITRNRLQVWTPSKALWITRESPNELNDFNYLCISKLKQRVVSFSWDQILYLYLRPLMGTNNFSFHMSLFHWAWITLCYNIWYYLYNFLKLVWCHLSLLCAPLHCSITVIAHLFLMSFSTLFWCCYIYNFLLVTIIVISLETLEIFD